MGDAAALLAAAELAADVAGAILRRAFRSGQPADLKSDSSPVTVADRSTELAMRALLGQLYPEHGITGEEFGTERGEARWRWVLDPIDGTRAFITGRPTFGTLIGLLDGDVPILGIIDQPISGERWIGMAGEPTRFRGSYGGVVGVRACPHLMSAELSCTTPDMMIDPPRPSWQRLAGAVRRVSWGGDCYAYGLLALGQIDVVAEAQLKLWDWVPLLPIIEGAGGRLTGWRGERLLPGNDGAVLAVGDPGLLDQAVACLR